MLTYSENKNKLWETLTLIKENSAKSHLLGQSKRRKYNYWTFNEDEKLMRLAGELNYDWIKISLEFIERSASDVEKRWKLRIDPNTKKTPWTAEEDQKIILLHKKLGGNWKLISKQLEGRLPSAIKNRYYSKLQKTENNLRELTNCLILEEEIDFKEIIKDTESVSSKTTSVSLSILSEV